jgi:hypothetical protein
MNTTKIVSSAAVALLATALLAGPVTADTSDRPTAEQGFAAIVKAVKSGEAKEVAWVLPESAVRDVTSNAAEVQSWRDGMIETLSAAKLKGAREEGDDAVVRISLRTGTFELPLQYREDRWHVASGIVYLVAGKQLKKARGRKAARFHLDMRTTNKQWKGTCYSFVYATGNPDACKNRMSVWFCHNGDLHTSGGGRVTDIGEGVLDPNAGLPVGAAWGRSAPATAGHVYVVQCKRAGVFDFFATMRITSMDSDGLDAEWTLLTGGPGIPASIHKEQQDDSNDGSDGNPGLCGRAGSSGGSTRYGGGRDGEDGAGGAGGGGGR